MSVRRKAGTSSGSMMGGDVGGASCIKGLNINQCVRPWAIKTSKHNVRGFREASARALHPSHQGDMSPLPTPFSNHRRGSKYGIQERDECLDSGVMTDRVEPQASSTAYKVAVPRENSRVRGVEVGRGMAAHTDNFSATRVSGYRGA